MAVILLQWLYLLFIHLLAEVVAYPEESRAFQFSDTSLYKGSSILENTANAWSQNVLRSKHHNTLHLGYVGTPDWLSKLLGHGIGSEYSRIRRDVRRWKCASTDSNKCSISTDLSEKLAFTVLKLLFSEGARHVVNHHGKTVPSNLLLKPTVSIVRRRKRDGGKDKNATNFTYSQSKELGKIATSSGLNRNLNNSFLKENKYTFFEKGIENVFRKATDKYIWPKTGRKEHRIEKYSILRNKLPVFKNSRDHEMVRAKHQRPQAGDKHSVVKRHSSPRPVPSSGNGKFSNITSGINTHHTELKFNSTFATDDLITGTNKDVFVDDLSVELMEHNQSRLSSHSSDVTLQNGSNFTNKTSIMSDVESSRISQSSTEEYMLEEQISVVTASAKTTSSAGITETISKAVSRKLELENVFGQVGVEKVTNITSAYANNKTAVISTLATNATSSGVFLHDMNYVENNTVYETVNTEEMSLSSNWTNSTFNSLMMTSEQNVHSSVSWLELFLCEHRSVFWMVCNFAFLIVVLMVGLLSIYRLLWLRRCTPLLSKTLYLIIHLMIFTATAFRTVQLLHLLFGDNEGLPLTLTLLLTHMSPPCTAVALCYQVHSLLVAARVAVFGSYLPPRRYVSALCGLVIIVSFLGDVTVGTSHSSGLLLTCRLLVNCLLLFWFLLYVLKYQKVKKVSHLLHRELQGELKLLVVPLNGSDVSDHKDLKNLLRDRLIKWSYFLLVACIIGTVMCVCNFGISIFFTVSHVSIVLWWCFHAVGFLAEIVVILCIILASLITLQNDQLDGCFHNLLVPSDIITDSASVSAVKQGNFIYERVSCSSAAESSQHTSSTQNESDDQAASRIHNSIQMSSTPPLRIRPTVRRSATFNCTQQRLPLGTPVPLPLVPKLSSNTSKCGSVSHFSKQEMHSGGNSMLVHEAGFIRFKTQMDPHGLYINQIANNNDMGQGSSFPLPAYGSLRSLPPKSPKSRHGVNMFYKNPVSPLSKNKSFKIGIDETPTEALPSDELNSITDSQEPSQYSPLLPVSSKQFSCTHDDSEAKSKAHSTVLVVDSSNSIANKLHSAQNPANSISTLEHTNEKLEENMREMLQNQNTQNQTVPLPSSNASKLLPKNRNTNFCQNVPTFSYQKTEKSFQPHLPVSNSPYKVRVTVDDIKEPRRQSPQRVELSGGKTIFSYDRQSPEVLRLLNSSPSDGKVSPQEGVAPCLNFIVKGNEVSDNQPDAEVESPAVSTEGPKNKESVLGQKPFLPKHGSHDNLHANIPDDPEHIPLNKAPSLKRNHSTAGRYYSSNQQHPFTTKKHQDEANVESSKYPWYGTWGGRRKSRRGNSVIIESSTQLSSYPKRLSASKGSLSSIYSKLRFKKDKNIVDQHDRESKKDSWVQTDPLEGENVELPDSSVASDSESHDCKEIQEEEEETDDNAQKDDWALELIKSSPLLADFYCVESPSNEDPPEDDSKEVTYLTNGTGLQCQKDEDTASS